MINNFICDNCSHYLVCEKLSKQLMKFHETAKKDLGITIRMEDCMDFCSEDGDEKDAAED